MRITKIVAFLVLMIISFTGCKDNYKEVVLYYGNGNIHEHFYQDDNGHITGKYESFHMNGNKQEVKKFVKGQLEGDYKKYYENGKIEMSCNMVNDLVDGEAYFYFKDGKIEEVDTYHRNKLQYAKIYHPNGKLKEMRSLTSFGTDSNYNTVVKFDANGKLIIEESQFVDFKLENNKLLFVRLKAGFFNSHQEILLRKNFNDSTILKRIEIEGLPKENILIDLEDSDFKNGTLNIEIRTYGKKEYDKELNMVILPAIKKYYIQLSKNEIPKKYNFDFIE